MTPPRGRGARNLRHGAAPRKALKQQRYSPEAGMGGSTGRAFARGGGGCRVAARKKRPEGAGAAVARATCAGATRRLISGIAGEFAEALAAAAAPGKPATLGTGAAAAGAATGRVTAATGSAAGVGWFGTGGSWGVGDAVTTCAASPAPVDLPRRT